MLLFELRKFQKHDLLNVQPLSYFLPETNIVLKNPSTPSTRNRVHRHNIKQTHYFKIIKYQNNRIVIRIATSH